MRFFVELAGEYLVGVGGINAISDLLDSCHSLFIVDLNVGLSTGHDEASLIVGIVDRVIPVLVVEQDVLDLIAEV